MSTREHLLTIVEPTPGGDATLELAHDTVARGGTATVVMVITDRVQRDIRAFAESEELEYGQAEALALDRLQDYCRARLGGTATVDTYFGTLRSDIVRYVTSETTAIALPTRLVSDRLIERLSAYTGRPVIVTPSLSAAA